MALFQAGPPRTHCPKCGVSWPAADQYYISQRGKQAGQQVKRDYCLACARLKLARVHAQDVAHTQAAAATRRAAQAAEPPRPTIRSQRGPTERRAEVGRAAHAAGIIGGYQPKKPAALPEDRFTDDLLGEVKKHQKDIVGQMVQKAREGDIQMLKFIADRMTRADDARHGPLEETLYRLWHRRRAEQLVRPDADLGAAGGDSGDGGDHPESLAEGTTAGPLAEWGDGEGDSAEWGGAGREVDGDGGGLAHLYPLDSA